MLQLFALATRKMIRNKIKEIQSFVILIQVLFKDVIWHPIRDTNSVTKLRFTSSGQYWQNSKNEGTWTLSNGCDSIYVVSPSIGNFYDRLLSVTTDSLKMIVPDYGNMTYYK